VRTYDQLRQALPITDADPAVPGNLILAYNGASVSGAWDGGATWNREHRWPDSIGLNGSGPDYSDMHHLTPCDDVINSTRGNDPFGTAASSGPYGPTGSYWYPGDTDRPTYPDFGNDTGDVARAMMYMAVRYDGQENGTVDLELKNGVNGTNQLGDLAALLAWHYRDAPSTFERRRNQRIFSNTDNPSYYQGNRNPFVDHPEYAWSIFGDGANDSKLYVGSTVPGNGTSTTTVDFGTVAVGAPLPAARTVTLTKAGSDPTYFGVTVSGLATCTQVGRNNPFNNGTRTLTVGFATGTTDSAGTKTGTVVVDNLDLSNQGTGTGALDGNDVITLTITVGSIVCPDPFADSDADGDVDQADFGALQLCYSGQEAYGAGCACYDRDLSGTIDLADYEAFSLCYSGPGVQANPNCD
jgi:endonuclease I